MTTNIVCRHEQKMASFETNYICFMPKTQRRNKRIALQGCLKGVKEALSSGSCVNQCDEAEGGMTPLMLAVGAKNIQIVDYLLKRSAIDVKRKDKDGWTALHMACVLGNSSAVLRLAKHYATIGETMEEESDIAKITPLMWCVRLGHMECFKELVAFPWVNLDTKDIYGQTLEDVAR